MVPARRPTSSLYIYAFSASPKLSIPAEKVDRETLLAAMKGITLGTAELKVVYTRSGDGERPGDERLPPRPDDRAPDHRERAENRDPR